MKIGLVTPYVYPLPGGLGLFVDSARMQDNSPVLVYYDRGNGELKLAKFNAGTGNFDAPTVIDGAAATSDAGWSPTDAVDDTGKIHIAYVSSSKIDLLYKSVPGTTTETIDDGYRIVGQTEEGLPKPEFHFVGEDATLIMPPGQGPTVIYQDSTNHELLAAQRKPDNRWARRPIAGNEDPFIGAFGFFASATNTPDGLAISSWVIDQANDANWVQVFLESSAIE